MNNKNSFYTGLGVGALIVAIVAVVSMFAFAANHHGKLFGTSTTPSSPSSGFDFGNFTQAVWTPVLGLLAAPGNATATYIQSATSTIVAATTTPCAVQNPNNATSTIIDSVLNITTATSSAANIVMATSSSPNATTSVVFQGTTVAANTQRTLISGESASSTGQGVVVGPKDYLVWGIGSGSGATYGYYTYGGTCSAIFQTVQ